MSEYMREQMTVSCRTCVRFNTCYNGGRIKYIWKDCKSSTHWDDINAHKVMIGYPKRRERRQVSRYREWGRGSETIWRPQHVYAHHIRILITFNTLHIIIALLQCAKPNFTPIHNLFNIQPVKVKVNQSHYMPEVP